MSDDVLTFVFNFVVPQMNPLGRLLPRYDLRNMVYFIERLNEVLAEQLSLYGNAFLFDLDQVVSTFGKKYFLDDTVWQLNHGSALEDSNWHRDRQRLEPVKRVGKYFPLRVATFKRIAWCELLAMYRTTLQIDSVKLVAVDIDDTLWRGVALEIDNPSPDHVEGWPLGVIEALAYLRRRGIVLAVLSRNDERRIADVWERLIYSRRLSLDDFAVKKINWSSKVQNMQEIISETNLLPKNIVVIDDSPIERAALKHAYPEIRVGGSNPYLWRRLLLWSSETQVPAITSESIGRHEAIKRRLPCSIRKRDSFLKTLRIEVRLFSICQIRDKTFPRALELLNKTNQFNTTGKRWSTQECSSEFKSGSLFWLFSVSDKFTNHGIVGVVVVQGAVIRQFVMSCRVIGMDVEQAVIAAILRSIRKREKGALTAFAVETEANWACRTLYPANGFTKAEDKYLYVKRELPVSPPYISVRLEEAAAVVRSDVIRGKQPASGSRRKFHPTQ